MYGKDRRYKFSLDTKQGLNHGMKSYPWNVTVNAVGVWYVTDMNPYVQMYYPQGAYKGRWVAVSPDGKPSNTENTRLWGLTIDSNGQLLVGQTERPVMYISRHREDGSHIASFKVGIPPYYLAATSQDLLVISSSGILSGSVQIVDSTGHVLHTLNANNQLPFWKPKGVCCYNDLILVCNSDHNNTHEMSCFSVSAEYMGSIAVCKRPWSIAKANCKLLVSTCNGFNYKVLVYANKMVTL